MTLLRRFARARLASRVIRRLRQAGVRDARYDARAFAIRFTPIGRDVPTVMELGGLLAEGSGGRRERKTRGSPGDHRARRARSGTGDRRAWLTWIGSGGRRRRRERIDRYVAGFLDTPGLPADWNTARPLLRPVLRGGTPTPPDVSVPLRRPALPFLAECVVVDQPDTMTYVSADQLAGWRVTADEVFAAARANLTGAVLHGVASEPTVVQFMDDGDAYWTSHLLLDGWLARLAEQVGGVPVAFAPERGTLIVAADGSPHLPDLFAQAERVYAAAPYAITPVAYVSDEHGHTIPYSAPVGHPLFGCVRRAEAVLAVTEYARQAATLDHAAELRLVGSVAEGWRTRAVWTRDEPVLLPGADEVEVGGAVRPWAEIEPHLTPVPELDPPRWQATAWPTT